MEDILTKTIAHLRQKGKQVEEIRKYLRERYKINIDLESLKLRIKSMSQLNA